MIQMIRLMIYCKSRLTSSVTKCRSSDLRERVDAREECSNLVTHTRQSVLEQTSVVVVEVVEEQVGVAGALVVGDPAAARVVLVGVTQDRCSHEWISSHVVETKILHQPVNNVENQSNKTNRYSLIDLRFQNFKEIYVSTIQARCSCP